MAMLGATNEMKQRDGIPLYADNINDIDIYDDEFEDFLVDYKDTFDPWDVEQYLEELNELKEDSLDASNNSLEYNNEAINLKATNSDLNGEQKNQTIKKMQFYISMMVGVVLMIFIIMNLISNMFSKQQKEEKIEQVEAPRVVKLEKENLFVKVKQENTEQSSKEDSKNSFVNSDNPFSSNSTIKQNHNTKNVKQNEDEDIFSSIINSPLKAQIVKGETSAIVDKSDNNSSNYDKEINKADEQISKYDEQIEQMQNEYKDLVNLASNIDNGGGFSGSNSNSDNNYSGSSFAPVVVKKSQFNANFLLPKGTYIGCSLDTRFTSDIEGSTSCTVSANVYSSNGNVLLIEKGSRIFGTYKGSNTNDGTSRYFVLWEEIRTPNHLIIPVSSGASDELGAAGFDGEIDHKWMMRFGSSIMLSAIDDAWNVLAYKITNGGSSANGIDYTEKSRENASKIAEIALEKFINVKPTVYKQHGDLVGVYVNKDIDFSKVYKISKKVKK